MSTTDQAGKDRGRKRIGRGSRTAFGGLAATLVVWSLVCSSALAAPFRAFSSTSPWNIPAAQKGSIDAGNPYASQFISYSSKLEISGTPSNASYASPVFFASPGDPATANVSLTTDWSPTKDLKWDRLPIPIPAGAYPAPGSDGHMTIVSADRTKAWEFWRCTSVSASGITTAVIVQWNLTGPGYSTTGSENSARGSGTPLISTSVRADELLGGINHALGITVPRVMSSYVFPVATHSDGSAAAGSIQYGMLFVLRADYPVPTTASIGVRNLIAALKTYGAYVIDQGASFELDADSTHPDLWSQAGVGPSSLGITPADMRLVHLGTGATPAPAPDPTTTTDPGTTTGGTTTGGTTTGGTTSGGTTSGGTTSDGKTCTKRRQRQGKCTLVTAAAVSVTASQPASPATVAGSVATQSDTTRRARIQKKTPHGWKTIGSVAVARDGSFQIALPHTKKRHTIRVRVLVPGVGASKTMKVRL